MQMNEKRLEAPNKKPVNKEISEISSNIQASYH